MIGGLSPWHWLLIIAVVAIFFGGKGKLSSIMGDAAKGVRAFKDGLKGEDEPPAATAPTSAQIPTSSAAASSERAREDIKS